MGAYRSKPITDKVSSDELGKYVKCGASSMQGWRVTQEDAHNCILEYDENASLFAVYDGHGGHEVAQYCSENLPQYLKECASYKNGDYVKALKEAFLGFDSTLVEPKVVKILKQIVKSADDELDGSENQNSGSEDEENIRNLYEEAQMPLEELMAKYQADGLSPALRKLKRGAPPSPHLTAKSSSKLKSSEEACSSKAGSSNSSCGVVPSEESSCESAEKEDEKSSNEETDSTESVSNGDTEEKATEKSVESNGEQKSKIISESNGDKTSQESQDSKNKTPEKSGRSSSSEKDDGNLEINSETVKEEVSNEVLKENVKSESGNEQKEEADLKKSPTKSVKEEKVGNEKEIKDTDPDKKDSSMKVEVNGDIEPKEMLKEVKKVPHENGDVADEESEEDEGNEQDEEKKSRKGKGKAIVKKIDLPKRTSARQRNMAILFHSLLLAQDSADSESDDEGDESFEGAEESSSNEEEDKEEAEAEGEDEDEEEDEEGGEGEGEEEEDDDYEAEGGENVSKLSKGPGVESGCTAVIALLYGRDLYVANAGDSRCIVSRSGEALDMSLDHKPEDDIEMERIVTAGGFVSCDGRVNGGLNLSRAIGDHAYKQTEHFPSEEQMITALPDVRTISLDPETDEFMVLACDGIWNSMTSQEVINFVRTRLQSGDKKLSAICEELFDFCLAPNTASDGTGCDNMTALIVQFLPIMSEVSSSDLPNTSINTAPSKRPASPSENSDSPAKRFKTGVV